ncbi:MAG: HEAT repeat domain-containing protein, partial [Planctomycetes bacterium]|nr:HEAT repeat domain-containing protein [Planctomycetota bacterium]
VLRDALRGAGAADWPALLAGLASLSGPEARPAVPLLVELASRPGGAEALPAVLRALERIGGPEAARALHALGRERPEAAEDAAARLSRIEDRDAAPALLEVLEAEGGRGPFAAGAARALGRTRLRAHVQRLAALAAGAADLRVREAAVEALGEVADPEALPALERLLEDPEARVRRPAIRALGRIRAPRSFAALEALLAREPPPLEESIAKEALARLRGEDPRLVR